MVAFAAAEVRVSPNAGATTEADLDSIRQLVADATEYQNDVEPLMKLHTEDTIIVNFGGRRVLGREAFRDAMRQALDSPLAKVFTTVEIEDVRFLSPAVAIASCTKTIRDERDAAQLDSGVSLRTAGAMSYVLVKQTSGWRIALAQTTPIRT
jgi:uncharacterized protein (TIGR02246 family)